VYANLGSERLLLSVDYGNVYALKQTIHENPHFPVKYWTKLDREKRFQKAKLEKLPKHFMKSYPLWVANGIVEDPQQLKQNAANIRIMANEIRTRFDDQPMIFNGVEKVVKFNVEVVTAGLVLEGGLLALSDYFNDNPTQVENEDNIIDDATPLQG
jgi:hypothetical protein